MANDNEHSKQTESIDKLLERAHVENARYFEMFDDFLSTGSDSGVGFGTADVVHWARQPYWTAEEVAALSLGKSPDYLNQTMCENRVAHQPFCALYMKRLETVWRHMQVGRLDQTVAPQSAVEWLISVRLHYPVDLEQAVGLLGHGIVDWNAEYWSLAERANELDTQLTELRGQHFEVLRERDEQLAEWQDFGRDAAEFMRKQHERISAQSEEIEQLRNTLSHVQTELKSEKLGTRERSTYEKIILAAAIGGYGFEPADGPSDVPKQIQDDGARVGIEVTDETISKKLRAAAERHLPGKPVE